MNQQQQRPKIEHSELSPSFNCYSSNSLTSTAIAKVIHEEQQGQDFEFSLMSIDDEEITSPRGWTVFPVFNPDLLVDNEFKVQEESSSYSSSSEASELENLPSGTFCVWRPKCKKSKSTGGSGSKKWIGIRYLLRRSNSEGKDPNVLLTPKQKPNSREVSKVVPSMLKSQTPVHEQFYVQRRAENEMVKRKTYLPYRQDLVGLFATTNGLGNNKRNFV